MSTKQWKIQQRAYLTRRRLKDPILYARIQRRKKRKAEKEKDNSKTTRKNKTEEFHAFFQSIIPIIQDMWADRCTDRNTPALGGRIVAEYDTLSKKVTQLYTMREMVLPEDELKIFDETLETRLEDTDQQLKKWMLTSEDKSIGSRKISKRKHATSKKMSKKTPLITKMFMKMGKKRSTSRNKEVLEVEKQIIDDRYGNVPVELLAR
jgi:hypothetical protein